jgi:hypothetical protein
MDSVPSEHDAGPPRAIFKIIIAGGFRPARRPWSAPSARSGHCADRERIWGAQHPETISTREKLADAAMADGRVKEAIKHYKRALADREEVLGPDHPDTIAGLGQPGLRLPHGRADGLGASALRAGVFRVRAGAWRRPPGHPGPARQPGGRLLHRRAAHRRDNPAARYRGAL